MKTAICTVLCLLSCNLLAQPTSAPATETLMKGEISFTIPAGWKLDGKANNEQLAKLSHEGEPQAAMAININVQPQALPDSAANAMSQHVIQMIRGHAEKGDFKLLEQPKAEKDDRFFMRIHHKFQMGATIGDELQIYRLIGKDLVTVAATAFTDSPDEAKPIFEDAEKTLLSVKSSNGAAAAHPAAKMKLATKATTLAAAKIAFNAPAGWEEQSNDNSSGIVATYHDPAENFNTIVISVRPLPPEAKKDPKARDAIVDEMVKGENASFKLDGANQQGEPEPVRDNRFLKKSKVRYEKADARMLVTSRVKRSGDVIVNVAMVALEPGANDVDRLADEVAVSVRASGR